jgi:hypothetical protein
MLLESFLRIIFASLKSDYSAQDRPRDLVSLEPLENQDSAFVFKIVHVCERNGNAQHLISS